MGDRIAALDQYEAEARDLSTALQAYIDKLDRQIAWHAKWDKWIMRVAPILIYLVVMTPFAVLEYLYG